MRTVTCESCGQEAPLRTSVKVAERSLCAACAEKLFATTDVPASAVETELDLTVCYRCGADNGDAPWATVVGLPTCPACTGYLRNRPFPAWIRWSMAGLVALVIGALLFNMRFMLAYGELRRSWAAMERGEVAEAARLMDAAARHVPEVDELRQLADFQQAVVLVQQNKSEEALQRLRQCRLPSLEKELNVLVEHAEIGAAFERKDYDRFLALAEEMMAASPDDPTTVAQVASACACKYAVTGQDAFRNRSLELLAKVKSSPAGLSDPTYEQRIRHRLETREIISREEFLRRFPQGWKSSKNEE